VRPRPRAAICQWQNDDRQEYEACIDASVGGRRPADAEWAARPAAQGTSASSCRAPARSCAASSRILPTLLASAGVRADAVRFRVRDRLISATNPDDSGERTLHAVSPAFGLVWRTTPFASVYATVSSSFETPTTTELGNKPDGSAGINPELDPQRALSLELGAKGLLAGSALRWEVAAFRTGASDELVPFDIPGGAGRRYFPKRGPHDPSGSGGRRGGRDRPAVAAGGVQLLPLPVRGLRGGDHLLRRQPDPRSARARIRRNRAVHAGSSHLSGTADVATAVDVDDANSAQAKGRTILGLALSNTIRVGGVRLSPARRIAELADVRSVGSVSVNATGASSSSPLLVARCSFAWRSRVTRA
jgi:iron complex outermembrane receptor protein